MSVVCLLINFFLKVILPFFQWKRSAHAFLIVFQSFFWIFSITICFYWFIFTFLTVLIIKSGSLVSFPWGILTLHVRCYHTLRMIYKRFDRTCKMIWVNLLSLTSRHWSFIFIFFPRISSTWSISSPWNLWPLSAIFFQCTVLSIGKRRNSIQYFGLRKFLQSQSFIIIFNNHNSLVYFFNLL